MWPLRRAWAPLKATERISWTAVCLGGASPGGHGARHNWADCCTQACKWNLRFSYSSQTFRKWWSPVSTTFFRPCDYSVHRISLQAGLLEWVALPFSNDLLLVSCIPNQSPIVGRFFVINNHTAQQHWSGSLPFSSRSFLTMNQNFKFCRQGCSLLTELSETIRGTNLSFFPSQSSSKQLALLITLHICNSHLHPLLPLPWSVLSLFLNCCESSLVFSFPCFFYYSFIPIRTFFHSEPKWSNRKWALSRSLCLHLFHSCQLSLFSKMWSPCSSLAMGATTPQSSHLQSHLYCL